MATTTVVTITQLQHSPNSLFDIDMNSDPKPSRMSSAKRVRSPSPPSASAPPPSLRNWLKVESTPPLPHPILASAPITDRQSTFVAHACSISAAPTATRFREHITSLRNPDHPREADHEILGWRTMSLKVGRKGLSEDDFSTRVGGEDDGEKNGSNTIKKAIEEAGAVDVCVVVSRYYGGVMLGPVRFDHIRAVTLDALNRLSIALSVETIAGQLANLDRQIADLTKRTGGTPAPPPKYDSLTEEKGDRLLKAREARLGLLKKKVAEVEGADEERRRREEEEDLAALEEQEREGEGGGDSVQRGAEATTFEEEDGDDEEEAEAARAMEAYLAERKRAKETQTGA